MKPTPTRFVILSRGRTGSTYLHQLLDSHCDCVSFEEVFAGRDLPPLPDKYPPHLVDSIKQHQGLRETVPVDFLKDFIHTDYPPNIAAVGFKLFYAHSRKGGAADLWNFLGNDTDMKIVHLRRRNLLRMFTSMKIAFKTGAWWSLDGSPALREKAVLLDADEFVEYVTQSEKDRKSADLFFWRHPVFHIDYEDYENYAADSRKIDLLLDFLELAPYRLHTTMKRQNPEPLRELILNYDELKAQFRETDVDGFFDE